MVNTSNSSRTPSQTFNLKRIYSNEVFSAVNQANVSDSNFKYIVSISQQPFIKRNILHNVFQMLLRIRNYWIENDVVVEEDDYIMRELKQRRVTRHPNPDKAKENPVLYTEMDSPIYMNDIIAPDVSLIENLIRFLYQFISNYAYFVMEKEDEEGFKSLSNQVRQTRLKDFKKDFPKKYSDYIQANKMEDVPDYQENSFHTGKGKGNCQQPTKQIVTEGSPKFLSIYQNKDVLALKFVRKLYQWILEKYVYCLNIPVEADDLFVTIENVNYPVIKENHNSGGDGQRMNYRTLLKHILSLLGLYEPLRTEINVEEDFDFFDMLGIQTKVDRRKNNGKRRRSSDSKDDEMTGKRQRTDDDDDDSGYELENDLE